MRDLWIDCKGHLYIGLHIARKASDVAERRDGAQLLNTNSRYAITIVAMLL